MISATGYTGSGGFELYVENKDIVAATASLLGTKTPMVNKMFKVLKQKMEDGTDEMEDLYNLINEVEGE